MGREEKTGKWYLIHTGSGHEEKVIDIIERKVSKNIYSDIWCAYRYEERRSQGQDTIHKYSLFPGYIFICTDQADEIEEFLNRASDFDGLLKTG